MKQSSVLMFALYPACLISKIEPQVPGKIGKAQGSMSLWKFRFVSQEGVKYSLTKLIFLVLLSFHPFLFVFLGVTPSNAQWLLQVLHSRITVAGLGRVII